MQILHLFRKMNASREIEVYEAATYFSGSNENSSFSQKILRGERNLREGRNSSDMAARNILLPQKSCSLETQMKEKINYRQPSSPGGRLANFLNSLFNQSSTKKKKKKKMKSSSTVGTKEEEESPGGTKKRRSSISHFRSYITMDSKSIYSSSTSGFRTPMKSLKEFTTQKHKSVAPANDGFEQKRPEKESLRNGFSERDGIWADKYPSEELRKMEVEDDGVESDTSSDLFELQIYDFYSNDLPVYESTSMEGIERGTIPNAHL